MTPAASDRVAVGVVGLGYWGPNLARNFAALPDAELRWCCDAQEPVRERIAWRFPRTRFTADLDDLLSDDALDAVVRAQPVPSPRARAGRVRDAGKHSVVGKPLAQSVEGAEPAGAPPPRARRTRLVGPQRA